MVLGETYSPHAPPGPRDRGARHFKHIPQLPPGWAMIRTQVSLDEQEYAAVKAEAEALGISVAEFVYGRKDW